MSLLRMAVLVSLQLKNTLPSCQGHTDSLCMCSADLFIFETLKECVLDLFDVLCSDKV